MDAGQPTTHFKVLKEYGLGTRRLIVDDKAPLYHVGAYPDHPPMYIIASDNALPNPLEQTHFLMSTLRQFRCPEESIRFQIRHGRHMYYADTLDKWRKRNQKDGF